MISIFMEGGSPFSRDGIIFFTSAAMSSGLAVGVASMAATTPF